MEAFPDDFNLAAVQAIVPVPGADCVRLADFRAQVVERVRDARRKGMIAAIIGVGHLSDGDASKLLGELLERFPGHVAWHRVMPYDDVTDKWVWCRNDGDLCYEYRIVF